MHFLNNKLKSGIKRGVSFLLSVSMLLTLDADNLIRAVADGPDTQYTMYANAGEGNVNVSLPGDATFDYGKKITLSLAGVNDEIIYTILKEGDQASEFDEYSSSKLYAPGSYLLGYEFEEDPTKKDISFEKYGLSIVKTQLSAPSSASFTEGSVAT